MNAKSQSIEDIHSHTLSNPTISISTLYNPLYIRIHIYITYTYNNNVLCAYIISYVCCANLLEVYKTPLSFPSSLSLVMSLIYESLLEFYTTCLMVACLPLAILKTCRKIQDLLEIYTMNRIVTKYNLLFDIMTLTFCNNHCQHLFICEIYNVNLNESNSHSAT